MKEQFNALKNKLETAIISRATLEKDFNSQTTLLIQFITKLSHVCKGIDLELDNRLAKLRLALTKSAPISEIEKLISIISTLLQQHTLKNSTRIALMHEQFHMAGKALQTINGLPENLRRDLRSLIKESEDSKESLIQYVDIFSQLLSFYDTVLKSKYSMPQEGLLNNSKLISKDIIVEQEATKADQLVVEKFTLILNSLVLSDINNKQLFTIKKNILGDISKDKLLHSFLETFTVIIQDFKQERVTAEVFLSTLNAALVTVKDAVTSTISKTSESKIIHIELNQKLQKQIIDMTGCIEKATTLNDIKNEINQKLQMIAGTLEDKYSFEHQHQKDLETQLNEMTAKVNLLENQSKVFEKRLHEQQKKSMQDALTKLANRAAFDDYFAQEMVRFHHKPFDLAIVVMDLDDFKRINDTYGHTAGDKTLQVIAATLMNKVADDVFVARYGGEEFVLIYSGIKQDMLINELKTLNKHISRLPFKFKNNKVSITTSIGVSYVHADDNIHTAFERADQGLYQAKSQGKNQVVYL